MNSLLPDIISFSLVYFFLLTCLSEMIKIFSPVLMDLIKFWHLLPFGSLRTLWFYFNSLWFLSFTESCVDHFSLAHVLRMALLNPEL